MSHCCVRRLWLGRARRGRRPHGCGDALHGLASCRAALLDAREPVASVSYRTTREQVAVVPCAFEEAAFDERGEQLLADCAIEPPQTLRLVSRQIETGHFEIFGANKLRP